MKFSLIFILSLILLLLFIAVPRTLNPQSRELKSWIESFKRWEADSLLKLEKMRKAEDLIRRGLVIDDPLSSKVGAVELLRAKALGAPHYEERV